MTNGYAKLPSMHKLPTTCAIESCQELPSDGVIFMGKPYEHQSEAQRDGDRGFLFGGYPILVLTITAIQLIVFVQGDASLLVVHIPLTRPENEFFLPRLFTYALVHANRMHLLSNLFVQLLAGVLIEISLGSFVFASIYLAGVVGGLLAEAATLQVPDGYSMVTVVGASCGIYAILLTGLAYVLINYTETRYAKWVVALYLALIFIEVTTSIVNPVANVSYVGHAFGALYGFATGIFVVPNLHKLPWERSLRLLCKILVPLSLAILLTVSLLR